MIGYVGGKYYLAKRYDSANTLFYLDSPYYGAEFYYKDKFSKQDHIDLANKLKDIKGKFVLSYYPCEITEKYYKDYIIVDKNVVKYSCGITKIAKSNTKPRATELLIMNYELPKAENNLMELFKECPRNGTAKLRGVLK